MAFFSKITGLGFYVPENVVTNDDLSKLMNLMKAFVTFLTSDIVSVMQLKVQPISEFHTELQ